MIPTEGLTTGQPQLVIVIVILYASIRNPFWAH
jgi:hypothetical protein